MDPNDVQNRFTISQALPHAESALVPCMRGAAYQVAHRGAAYLGEFHEVPGQDRDVGMLPSQGE